MFNLRLVAYKPNGDSLGPLPDPLKVSASIVHNDVGALTATYSIKGLRGQVLDQALAAGIEIAVEVTNHQGEWVEPYNCRFLWIAKDTNLADAFGLVQIKAPSVGWMLRKSRLLSTENLLPADHSQAGMRPFYTASAGNIVATLHQENQTRRGIKLDLGFGAAKDSAGAAWSQVITLYYEPGIDLLTVLDNLTAQGMCDWRTQGSTLHAWNPDKVCTTDRSASVRLHLGLDLSEAPSSESLEEVAGRVMLRGDEGLTLTLENPSAPSPWGVWEEYISHGGVSDPETSKVLVQTELERRARTRAQYTRELILHEETTYWPLVDYHPGDWITAPTTINGERVRIQQITLTLDEKGVVGGSLILNDKVLDDELRRAKRTNGIVGGSSASGGSGARPAPQGPDNRTPAKVTGLVVRSDAYIDPEGNQRGTITAQWAPVTTATDGTALEVDRYEMQWRRNIIGAPWQIAGIDIRETTAGHGPLTCGEEIQVQVRARGTYATQPGQYSDPVTLVVAADTTPPPAPSKLNVSVALAVVDVTWDGKTANGTAMPTDFSHILIYQDGVTEPVGRLYAAGTLNIAGLAYGSTVKYTAKAVDRAGNISSASIVSGSVTVKQLVDTDLIDGIITEVKLANKAVAEAKISDAAITEIKLAAKAVTEAKLSDYAITEIKVATGAITTVKIKDDAITAPKIIAGAITTDKLSALAVTAAKIAANAITTEKLDALAVTTAKLAALAITSEKIAANAITTQKLDSLAVTTEKIAALAITGAKIAALTIEAGNIAANAITADKIKAGAIDGKVIIGATIKTRERAGATDGATDDRQGIVINGSNLRGFNAAGEVVTQISASGVGTFTGSTFRTAASGARVQFDASYIRGYDASRERYRLDTTALRFYNSEGTETITISGAGATISAGTITGATIRTAASGKRIVLASNQFTYYNSDGNSGTLADIISRLNTLRNVVVALHDTFKESSDSFLRGVQNYHTKPETGVAFIPRGFVHTIVNGIGLVSDFSWYKWTLPSMPPLLNPYS